VPSAYQAQAVAAQRSGQFGRGAGILVPELGPGIPGVGHVRQTAVERRGPAQLLKIIIAPHDRIDPDGTGRQVRRANFGLGLGLHQEKYRHCFRARS
jgi:hypothetical protein